MGGDRCDGELEIFVCAIYGSKKIAKIDEFRHFLLKSKCSDDISAPEGRSDDISATTIQNLDLTTLPPSRACLIVHIRRANYQVRIWKTAHRNHRNAQTLGWLRLDG